MGKEGSLYSQSWSVESDENTRASQGGAAQTNGATDGRRRSELPLPCSVSVRRAGAKEARIVQREMVLRCVSGADVLTRNGDDDATEARCVCKRSRRRCPILVAS